MKEVKVIIADDHRMLRKAWELLINRLKDIIVIGEAANGVEVLGILSNSRANIVLMDIDMPIMNGFETTKIIKEKYPWIKVIAISMYDDTSYVKKMLRLGIAGYLTKNSSTEELLNAIEIVKNGGKYICSEVQNKLLEKIYEPDPEKLSSREKEIVQLIIEGLSSKEISEKLFLSIKTIESHRGNIYKKLKVKNIAELIHFVNDNFLF
jgi:DNA-binding NarL/FixJ family response regulator